MKDNGAILRLITLKGLKIITDMSVQESNHHLHLPCVFR